MSSPVCPLAAGAARVDITPPLGTHLSGDVGRHRPATGVLEPTYARALVLQSGERRCCLLVLDVTLLTAAETARLRQAVQELWGGAEADTIVCATQTHSAPGLGKFMLDPGFPPPPPEAEWLWGGEAAYTEWAVERATEAVRLAVADLEPVEVGAGSGVEGRLAFNRRAVGKDGTVGMPGRTWPEPLGPTWISHLEGPIDPELGVIALRGAGGLKCLLVHYTCHPVHVFPRTEVSPDWPGALCEELEQAYGAGCTALVLNGACGNLNPWPPFEHEYANDHRRMGRLLAETARRVVAGLHYQPEVELAAVRQVLPLPLRRVSDAELAEAQRVLSAQPGPAFTAADHGAVTAEWVAAASLYSVYLQAYREGYLPYEVQALRLGKVGLLALPGEPFVEGQLQIKLQSPAELTYIAHCASQYVGYVPTAEALGRGGHEVQTRYWAKLQPAALRSIVGTAAEVLGRLFG